MWSRMTFIIMIGLIVANLSITISEFAGIAAAGELFGVSKYLLIPICGFFIWLMTIKLNYKSLEKFFLLLVLFYIAYIISGFMAKKIIYGIPIMLFFLLALFIVYLIQVYPEERASLLEESDVLRVTIKAGEFTPDSIKIGVGSRVVWTNRDNVKHKVSGGKFESGVLYPGHSFSHVFTESGIYDYSCAFYPSMKGTIIVE